MKYGWAIFLVGLAAFVLFNKFFVVSKNNLAAIINLESLDKPVLIKQAGRRVLVAKIYSTYPFNHRNLVSINAGARDGVAMGVPVTVDGNVLLGRVVEVGESYSVVMTIFDNDLSIPARIGQLAVDALLVGGQEPRLTLIDQNHNFQKGDTVYAAGSDFPYGLRLGEVGEIVDSSTTSFKEAGLSLSYQLKSVKEVALFIDHVRHAPR